MYRYNHSHWIPHRIVYFSKKHFHLENLGNTAQHVQLWYFLHSVQKSCTFWKQCSKKIGIIHFEQVHIHLDTRVFAHKKEFLGDSRTREFRSDCIYCKMSAMCIWLCWMFSRMQVAISLSTGGTFQSCRTTFPDVLYLLSFRIKAFSIGCHR